LKFRREDGELDVEAFEHAVDTSTSRRNRGSLLFVPTPEIEADAKATASSASSKRTSARC